MNKFRHNHYVPEWFQRRFMPEGQGKYHYRDLIPERVRKNGSIATARASSPWAGKLLCPR